MDRKRFERLVAEVGFSPVPEKFRAKLKNVALTVEDEPSDDVRKDFELADDETLLGLYLGIPLTERGSDYGIGPTLPDRIVIYYYPTLDEAEDANIPVRQVVAETIWHEVAHHFGLDEDEVAKREEELRRAGGHS